MVLVSLSFGERDDGVYEVDGRLGSHAAKYAYDRLGGAFQVDSRPLRLREAVAICLGMACAIGGVAGRGFRSLCLMDGPCAVGAGAA